MSSSSIVSYLSSLLPSKRLVAVPDSKSGNIKVDSPVFDNTTGFTTVNIQTAKPWIPATTHLDEVNKQETKLYWTKEVYTYYDSISTIVDQVVVHYVENHSATQSGRGHAFYDMFQLAYANHGEVVLRPEDVFCCISQQFAHYVDENAELLRDLFVEHKGKKELIVDMDDVGINWEIFMDRVVDKITLHTKGDITNVLDFDFTTSTVFDKTLAALSIMTSMKHYFEYTFRTCCGIRKIHFTGTLEDWIRLRTKVKHLTERYDRPHTKYFPSLQKWGQQLDEILAQFIETYQGRVNVGFWNGVLDIEQTYGSGATTTIRGWMTRFLCNKDQIQVRDIPNVNFKVPVKMDLNGTIKFANIVGGFSGIHVDNKTSLIQCQRSYAVVDVTPSKQSLEKRAILMKDYDKTQHELEETRLLLLEAAKNLSQKCHLNDNEWSCWNEVSLDTAREFDAVDLFNIHKQLNETEKTLYEASCEQELQIRQLPISTDDLEAAKAQNTNPLRRRI